MLTAESGKKQVPPTERRDRTAQNEDPRWQLVERIAESRSLGKSALLAEFLRYVSDRHLLGKAAEITEQQIGVRVFGRVDGYNCNDDNIVRSYARTLRKRLEEYFNNEGREEPLRLSIPRGGYIPVFSPREMPKLPPVEVETPHFGLPPTPASDSGTDLRADPEKAPTRLVPGAAGRPLRILLAGLALLLAFVLTAALGFLAGRSKMGQSLFASDASRTSDTLWSHIFESDRDTFVVPADGGLVMMQSFSRNKIGLAEYLNGSYRTDSAIAREMQGLLTSMAPLDQATLTHKVSVLAARRYTSVVDLGLTARLAQLHEAVPERLVIRFARDLRIDDLRGGNAILIGSNDANPWVGLFTNQRNFQFAHGNEFGGSESIINTHPLAGERDHYASVPGDPSNRTYGILAYGPNLEGTGHVLLIEGVNMAGTQAAGDFLLQPQKMEPILKRALDARGNLRPFEVLLETTSIGADASRSEVLSERVHGDSGG
jgi:hypothetical protein